jgi:hypothetical protein
MSKDPAVLFYTADFLTGSMFMTDEQAGKYIRALCAQHLHGHLPEEKIMQITKNDSDVMAKFRKDNQGNFYNKRMHDEAEKRKSYSESRANNRKNKGLQEKHMKNISKSHDNTYEKHMENENINININKSLSLKEEESLREKDIAFDRFWSEYPKKIGKGAARRSWSKIKRPSETLGQILVALKWQLRSDQWTRDGGQYIPHPATYLNQTRWEDEPVEPPQPKTLLERYEEYEAQRVAE